MTGGNPACGSGGGNLLMINLPALLFDAGIIFAVILLNKATGPFVNIDLAGRGRGGILPRLEQPGVGLTKIIIFGAKKPWRDAIVQRPLANAFKIGTVAKFDFREKPNIATTTCCGFRK